MYQPGVETPDEGLSPLIDWAVASKSFVCSADQYERQALCRRY